MATPTRGSASSWRRPTLWEPRWMALCPAPTRAARADPQSTPSPSITLRPDTEKDLRRAEARYQRAFRRSEELREERNAAVRAALDAGWTHARIAGATGLTRGRIGQMAQS